MMTKRPFLLAALIGTAALAFSLLISIPLKNYRYECPSSFGQPMVALEFIGSLPELQTFFGKNGDQTAGMEAMAAALGRDFLFITAYAFFLIAFAHAIFRQRQKRRYLLLALLAACIGLADIFENGAIKILMERLQENPAEVQALDFKRLHLFTWTKWLGLAIYFAAAVPFLRRSGWFGQILAVLALGLIFMAAVAIFNRNWIEPYTTLVFVLFPLTVLFCYIQRSPGAAPGGVY